MNVTLKDIDIQKIILYTGFPLLLQARVAKSTTCTGMIMGSLVWSCDDVNWQFWSNIGNNNTVGMDPDDLKKLPKSKEITMQVTQFYKIKDIEFKYILTFVLFFQRDDLIPVLNYPWVFNPRENSNLVLDSNSSIDPSAIRLNTTDVPIKCTWTCPKEFADICANSNVIRANNGCTLTIPSVNILTNTNYNFNIQGNFYMFKNTLTKDSRATTSNIWVSIVDNNYYPKCSLNVQRAYQNSINMH